MHPVITFIIGVAIGFLVAIVGLGGGTLFVPTLLFVYGFDIHSAVSTSILIALFTTSSAYLYYRRKVKINYKLGTLLEVATIPGGVIGSYFTNIMSKTIIEFLFATVLSLSALKLIHEYFSSKRITRTNKPLSKIKKSHLIIGLLGAFLAGFISGSVGLSGGSIKVPILILVIGIPERVAIATSTYMMILTTIANLTVHNIYGKINYFVGLIMGTGAFIGAQIGGRTNLRLNQRKLRLILGAMLLLISTRVFLDIFSSCNLVNTNCSTIRSSLLNDIFLKTNKITRKKYEFFEKVIKITKLVAKLASYTYISHR
ncbi:MAG: sulfite exporter TauE/SafE family protein [Candidatus Njordarchaeales archaeon]